MDKLQIAEWFKSLQDQICAGLEGADCSGIFEEDEWERPGGGGGRTRIIQGEHIEKGGVNFSAVEGDLNPKIAQALQLNDTNFFATGVSIVLHPHNPLVPIIHMNVRYFETGGQTWWFGGGIDLTPHYINPEDAKFFHQQLKSTCDKYGEDIYEEYKKWADDYFYIKHREETRGVGGIFYDKLHSPKMEKEKAWNFTQDIGLTFLPTYVHLLEKNKNLPFTDRHKEWQKIRRGRYVEFNLVWDRGTKFGLETGGRIESILMSLPKEVNWEYNHIPEAGSEEAITLNNLRKGINWLSVE